jgi:hypothetical protein
LSRFEYHVLRFISISDLLIDSPSYFRRFFNGKI